MWCRLLDQRRVEDWLLLEDDPNLELFPKQIPDPDGYMPACSTLVKFVDTVGRMLLSGSTVHLRWTARSPHAPDGERAEPEVLQALPAAS